jgi:hypothetical protein
VQVIFIRLSLTCDASFYSVGCEAYRLEFGVKIFVYSDHVALEVMMDDDRPYLMSGYG